MANIKNIDVNGANFPCPVVASIDEAEKRIRSRYNLTGGGLEDANGALFNGTALISVTVGALFFIDGQQIVPTQHGD
jgi:hypothetical protein